MAKKAISIEDRFWSKVDIRSQRECWKWTGAKNAKGYGAYKTIYGNTAHRFAAHVSRDIVGGEGPIVMHMCDNPPCCNPHHLRFGTYSQNNKDAFSRGRNSQVGEAHSRAKLKEQTVREIKTRLHQGQRVPELAKLYGMSESAIYHIAAGTRWGHVTVHPSSVRDYQAKAASA